MHEWDEKYIIYTKIMQHVSSGIKTERYLSFGEISIILKNVI